MAVQFSNVGGIFEATLLLPSWQGFQSRKGPYAALDSAEPSNGVVQLYLGEGRDEQPPTEKEIAQAGWLIENEAKVSRSVVHAILEQSDSFQERFDLGAPLALKVEADLRTSIGLHAVHLHQIEKAGLPYLGFEFGCEWEDHGLGVMTCGTRVVEIGHADVSLHRWIAERDAHKQS